MVTRAGVIVTGTEVLTGRVTDRNGPWLAEQLRLIGVDIAQIVVVGDRPDDLRRSLSFLRDAGVDLIITSGGLGPTADDLTAQVVADFYGLRLELDVELHLRVAAVVARLSANRGWIVSTQATEAGTRKQALVPVGATVLEPIGTAPGLIVSPPSGHPGPPVLVLPGPPRELQGMWPAALADPLVQRALGDREELRQATIRMWELPESALAQTLREHDQELAGLEVTTCLREGEVEVVTRYRPDAQSSYDRLRSVLLAAHPESVFSADGETIDDLVAAALRRGGLTIATAESCTAGLVAGRLTDLAGSSDYVLGGIVTYSNQAKRDLLGVEQALLDQVGAVSAEVAESMAAGARHRLGADLGVGVTGIAGPGGATPGKPVGLVHLCVSTDSRMVARQLNLHGGRRDIRSRTVTYALHAILELLS